MKTFTAEEKWECAGRELRLRTRVYPRWIAKHNMTQDEAARELELMAAIVEDYRALAAKERLL
jgi:hypothetical protein